MFKQRKMLVLFVGLAVLVLAAIGVAAQPDTERPFIGIGFAPDGMSGVLVEEIFPDSPAEDAGLQVGDVLVGVDDVLLSARNVGTVLGDYQVGDTVTLAVLRGDDTLNLELTLAAAPDNIDSDLLNIIETLEQLNVEPPRPRLGIAVDNAPDGGALVMNVLPNSAADQADLQRGDVITTVNDAAIDSATALVDVVNQYGVGDVLTMTVERDGETLTLEATLEMAPPRVTMRGDNDNMRPNPNGFGDRPNMPRPFMFEPDAMRFDDGVWTVEKAAENSSLYELGLREGDQITAINGEAIESREQLFDFVHGSSFAADVELTVERDGESVTVNVPTTFIAAMLMTME